MITRLSDIALKSTGFIGKCFKEKKPPIAYIGGYLGKQNLGDEALFLAAKSLFNEHNLIHYDGSRTLTFLMKKLSNIKGGILAGGTLINRGKAWLDLAERFCEFCPQLYIFGTGVANPFFWSRRPSYENILNKWVALLERCQYVGVRGPMSAEVLLNAGVKNVEIIGDPVLSFADKEINDSYHSNCIGLNIGYTGGNHFGDEATTLSEYIKLARMAKDSNWTVKWFVVWPQDYDVTWNAASNSNTSSYIYKLYDNPKAYMDLVRPMSVFVGMKLHSTILATCAYVPSIMVEYRPKCRDYMQSIGQEAATFSTNEFKADLTWEIVRSWNSKRRETVESIFVAINKLRTKQQLKAQELMNRMLSF